MPTFIRDIQNRQITLTSSLSIPSILDQGEPPRSMRNYNSLLDTGAQGTMISTRVVNDIGLVAVGEGSIMGVNGEAFETRQYRVRVDIPVTSPRRLPSGKVLEETYFRGSDMNVSLFPYQPENFDVLLGMDFLSGFHITLVAGKLIMSS